MDGYRDDGEALRHRCDELERQNEALRQELAEVKAELEQARRGGGGIAEIFGDKKAERGEPGTCASCGAQNKPTSAFCTACGCSDLF